MVKREGGDPVSGEALGELTFLGETTRDLRLLQRAVFMHRQGGARELQEHLASWVTSQGLPLGPDKSQGVLLRDDAQANPVEADAGKFGDAEAHSAEGVLR